MSELSEKWQKLRGELGAFTGEINSLIDRYEPMRDVEEKAYQKGYKEGFKKAIAITKKEFCKDCEDKSLAEKCYKHQTLLCNYDKLPYEIQSCIEDLVISLRD